MAVAIPRVLLVDLNNFARFPTLSVGLIAAAMRQDGIEVTVLSPLAVGMTGLPRAGRARAWEYWREAVAWWSASSASVGVRNARSLARTLHRPGQWFAARRLEDVFRRALHQGADVVLVSAYLMYHRVVARLARTAARHGVPVVLGGPAFHEPSTRDEWLRIPGVTGLLAGECEPVVPGLVRALVRGQAPRDIPGYSARGRSDGGLAAPLENLDALPFPDYTDFPWDLYPNRIVSMLTGRGCGWGACRFCSDVVSVNGRGFRSRSLDNVLGELEHHHRLHRTRLFCFSDLKLNSNLEVWRGLHRDMQRTVPGARWTCAVHHGTRDDEGLSEGDLRAARSAGLVRITTGLESGSQRLLDSMAKGLRLADLVGFLASAESAGVSVRLTAFTGYPGETAADVRDTARFLREHSARIDRVHLSRLLIQSGTPLERQVLDGSRSTGDFSRLRPVPHLAEVHHHNSRTRDWSYRSAVLELLRAVHEINRRPLRDVARDLEGAM